MSDPFISREVIAGLMKQHHRPLSARRLLMLFNQDGEAELNYGEMLVFLRKWAREEDLDESERGPQIREIRRGVFALGAVEVSDRSSSPLAEPESPPSTRKKHATRVGTKPSKQGRWSKSSLSSLVSHDGQSGPMRPISREQLENSERISGYLSPYSPAPVSVEDVVNARDALGDQFHEALRERLLDEVQMLNQALNLNLTLPSARASSSSAESRALDEATRSKTRSSDLDERENIQANDLDIASLFTRFSSSPCQSLDQLVTASREDHQAFITERDAIKDLIEYGRQEAIRNGARPPFEIDDQGIVFATSYGLNEELRTLETKLTRLKRQYQEAFERHFLQRLQSLPLKAFEALVFAWLKLHDFQEIEVLNRRGRDRLALMGQLTSGEAILIIIQRGDDSLSEEQLGLIERSLTGLFVESGIVINLAGFETKDTNKLTLIDGPEFSRSLCDGSIGVSHYTSRFALVNEAWLDQRE